MVPFESTIVNQQLLVFDNTNGHIMGVALVNLDPYSDLTVAAVFCAEDGSIIGTDIFTMKPLAHKSYVLSDRRSVTANRQGTIYFRSASYGLAVLGLRFNSSGAFTSIHSLETHD